MPAKYLRRNVCARVQDTVYLDPRDKDLLRAKLQVVIRFGRATARVMCLREDGHLAMEALHRVVALRHIRPPSADHTIVEALNGNRLDCRAANLEWRKRSDTNYRRSLLVGAPEGLW